MTFSQPAPVSQRQRRHSWALIPSGLVLFGLALALGLVAKSYGSSGTDYGVDVSVSEVRSPVVTALALGINYFLGPLGASILLAAVGAWLMWVRRTPTTALAVVSFTTVGWLGAEVGKFVVGRPRPPGFSVDAVISQTGLDSFPSGHTAFAASLSLALVVVLVRPGGHRLWALGAGAGLTLAVGFSRIYLGVHYPTDIVGSVLVTVAAFLVWLPVWNNRIEPRLARTPWVSRWEAGTR